jgi:hypothetical protein
MALADEMIKTIMKNLDCDEETAKNVIECDKRIDKGEKLFELSEELEKGAKKARSAGNCKGYTKPTNREKKVDDTKKGLIELLTSVIAEQPACNSLSVTNPEREFNFLWGDKKYKIVLSCPRK